MKLLKIALISYAIKTVLIAIAWLAIPDLPQRAKAAAQQSWAWVCSTTPAEASPASTAASVNVPASAPSNTAATP